MLGGQPVDLVLSDMAPNKSGMDAVDQPRMMHLAELAMDFADRHLRPEGTFLIKLFQGVGFDEYVRELRRRYAKVVIRKPEASRKRSPEVYALGQGKLLHAIHANSSSQVSNANERSGKNLMLWVVVAVVLMVVFQSFSPKSAGADALTLRPVRARGAGRPHLQGEHRRGSHHDFGRAQGRHQGSPRTRRATRTW
jgi:hypothetical protein